MFIHQAFFCLDCEAIEKPVTTEERLQCPRCGSRAIFPVINWINPYSCGDCGHIGRPMPTDLGLRCERCTSINVKLHVVNAVQAKVSSAPREEAAHA